MKRMHQEIHLENNSMDSKKKKVDDMAPSCVLHLRGVPQDVSESEVINLVLRFGRIVNLVLSRGKYQALIEMESVDIAEKILDHYNECPAMIRFKQVYFQFSSHQHLDTSHTQQFKRALEVAEEMAGDLDDGKTILRVIIENMLCPVTLDVLKLVFSKHGQVQKIITYRKNNSFQALIQLSDAISARLSMQNLNGQNIYNGSCTMRIDYSHLNQLQVKYNNDKSYDFTNPDLPSGIYSGSGNLDVEDGILGSFNDGLNQLASLYPSLSSHGHHNANSLMNIPVNPPVPSLMGRYAPPLLMRGGMGGDFKEMMRGGNDGYDSRSNNTVVIVSNLNEDRISCDSLFNLFGVYGEIVRIKIMYNKKDTALIQYKDPFLAQNAVTCLENIRWWGKDIKVSFSKHSSIQMPKEGDCELTKDYSKSRLQRIIRPTSKQYEILNKPSAVLHITNIPDDITEEELSSIFNEFGTVIKIKFVQKEKKMAFVQMASIEEATGALVDLHNFELPGPLLMKISFTKTTI